MCAKLDCCWIPPARNMEFNQGKHVLSILRGGLDWTLGFGGWIG
jgi:hypothetical protein